MAFDLNSSIDYLACNAIVFESLTAHLSEEQMRWKPDAQSWSLLEVVNHLYDEERWDFKRRAQLTLATPQADWPPNDPQAWAVERRYNEHDPCESLRNFLQERQRSLDWLRSLDHPNWESRHTSSFGSLSAGDLIASWVAHDFLHLRQISELHYLWQARHNTPYDVSYAGDW